MAATMLPFYCSEGAMLYTGPQHLASEKATILPSRATIVPSSFISPSCNITKVNCFLGNPEILLKNSTKPISRPTNGREDSTSASRTSITILPDMLLCINIFFDVKNIILLRLTWKQLQLPIVAPWGASWLSGCICLVCNCLPSSRAVTPLGLLWCPGVLSGSQPVLAACVWLLGCVMSG